MDRAPIPRARRARTNDLPPCLQTPRARASAQRKMQTMTKKPGSSAAWRPASARTSARPPVAGPSHGAWPSWTENAKKGRHGTHTHATINCNDLFTALCAAWNRVRDAIKHTRTAFHIRFFFTVSCFHLWLVAPGSVLASKVMAQSREFKLWIPSAREIDSSSGSSYTVYEIHVQVSGRRAFAAAPFTCT